MPTERQLEQRRNHVGGSDVAAILGVDPWRSPVDVWFEKTGQLEPLKPTAAMRAGTIFESGLLAYAEDELGPIRRNVERRAPGLPLVSHIDAVVMAEQWPIEAKWSTAHATETWGDAGTDQVPDRVIVQAHAHIICMTRDGNGPELCYVTHHDAFKGLALYVVPRSAVLCQAIADAVGRFWDLHVIPGTPPDAQPSLDVVKRIRRQANKTVPVDGDQLKLWRLAKEVLTDAEDKEKRRRADVIASMGDADAGDGGEAGSVTFFKQTRRAHSVAESTFRQLRFKKAK